MYSIVVWEIIFTAKTAEATDGQMKQKDGTVVVYEMIFIPAEALGGLRARDRKLATLCQGFSN